MRTFDDECILEQTISAERVYDGLILHIDRLTNRLPNGKLALREVARHIGASAVLPLDEDGNVYLVRQYRAAHRPCIAGDSRRQAGFQGRGPPAGRTA